MSSFAQFCPNSSDFYTPFIVIISGIQVQTPQVGLRAYAWQNGTEYTLLMAGG